MSYGAAHGITFDDELYFVSAMLHDIALTDPFDSHRVSFEEAGGNLAWVFGVAAGWPVDRAARAAEIIVLHMRDDVSAVADPESHMLQVATGWDVVGRRSDEFSSEVRAALRPHPLPATVPRESGPTRSTARWLRRIRVGDVGVRGST